MGTDLEELAARVARLESEVAALKKKRPPKKSGFHPIPPRLAAVPGFSEAWERRLAALPKSRRPTPEAQAAQLAQAEKILATRGGRALVEAVEHAINCGWQGFMASWTEPGRKGAPPTRDSRTLGPDFNSREYRDGLERMRAAIEGPRDPRDRDG